MNVGAAQVGAVKVPQVMPQVMAEVEQLNREIECCSKNVSELVQRLSGILRPEPPTQETQEKQSDTSVPLAQALRISVNKVRELADGLTSIINRIEV